MPAAVVFARPPSSSPWALRNEPVGTPSSAICLPPTATPLSSPRSSHSSRVGFSSRPVSHSVSTRCSSLLVQPPIIDSCPSRSSAPIVYDANEHRWLLAIHPCRSTSCVRLLASPPTPPLRNVLPPAQQRPSHGTWHLHAHYQTCLLTTPTFNVSRYR